MKKNKPKEVFPDLEAETDTREIVKKAKRFARFQNACILDLMVEHNGEVSGDAGHGGFINLKLEFDSFAIDVDFKGEEKADSINNLQSMSISILGEYERKTFISALKIIVDELETPIVGEKID